MNAPSSRSPLAPVRSWPEELRDRYRAAGLWTDETFDEFVTDRTTRFADNLAVVGKDAHGNDHRWTYRDLAAQAEHAAGVLSGVGVREGDRVIVALPNVVEFAAFIAGCFRLGALPVFAQPGHREAELTQFCLLADAAALVVCGDTDGHDHLALTARVGELVQGRGGVPAAVVDVQDLPVAATEFVLPKPRPDDIAFLQLSGGTTGISKLIPARTPTTSTRCGRRQTSATSAPPRGCWWCSLPGTTSR